MTATALVAGVLMYLTGWLSHASKNTLGAAQGGWTGAPRWLRLLLRRGSGPILPFPMVLQLLGLVFLARYLVLVAVLPKDPFDGLTREAITVGIFLAGAATLAIYLRAKVRSRR